MIYMVIPYEMEWMLRTVHLSDGSRHQDRSIKDNEINTTEAISVTERFTVQVHT